MYIVSITILDDDNGAIIYTVSFLSYFANFADFKLWPSCNIENKEISHNE